MEKVASVGAAMHSGGKFGGKLLGFRHFRKAKSAILVTEASMKATFGSINQIYVLAIIRIGFFYICLHCAITVHAHKKHAGTALNQVNDALNRQKRQKPQ